MNTEREEFAVSDLSALDRRVIRIDMPPEHAGITAALRRAFEAAAAEPSDRDFAELLRRLNLPKCAPAKAGAQPRMKILDPCFRRGTLTLDRG
jgi:hypothetical protein